MIAAILAIILIGGYFINKSNNADKERLKQAQIAHQQKLENEKAEELNKQKQLEFESKQRENERALKVEAKKLPSYRNDQNTTLPEKKGDIKSNYSEDEWMSICKSSAEAAKSIMSSRQKGAAMTDMMDKVVGAADPAVRDVIKAYVIEAYNKPRYNTPEIQQKEVLDFENSAYLTCIKVRQ